MAASINNQSDKRSQRTVSEAGHGKSDPLVSVVIPIFNHEQYIVECLESIKRDKYKRLELVAIDDGSSDNSYGLAASWLSNNKNRFESVKLNRQLNAGIAVTFNCLVHQSAGEYIFPLASDDQVATDGIYHLVRYYQSHFSEPTLVFSNAELIDLEGLKFAESAVAFRHKNEALMAGSRQFLSLDVITSWGMPYQFQFYPRTLFDAIGGYAESLKFEDLYFALKNVARGSVAYAPLKSRRYRIRPKLASTPGLGADEISPVACRRLVAPDFNIVYRFINLLFCYKGSRINGNRRGISGRMLSIFRWGIMFFYSRVLRLWR